MRKIISHLFNLLKLIHKGLTEKDPSFLECYTDYEAYHETSHISPLTRLRAGWISEWIKHGSSVLDVGCGEGVYNGISP